MENIAEEGGDAFQISESKFRIQRDITPLMNEVDKALKQKENNGSDMLESEQREMLFSGAGGGYRAPSLFGNDDANCCGRNQFKSPNYPSSYFPNDERNWLITANVGSIINLWFHF